MFFVDYLLIGFTSIEVHVGSLYLGYALALAVATDLGYGSTPVAFDLVNGVVLCEIALTGAVYGQACLCLILLLF